MGKLCSPEMAARNPQRILRRQAPAIHKTPRQTARGLCQNIPVAERKYDADKQKGKQYSLAGTGIAEIDELAKNAAPRKKRIFLAFSEPAFLALLADDSGGKGEQDKS
jgi:hypothetical protein